MYTMSLLDNFAIYDNDSLNDTLQRLLNIKRQNIVDSCIRSETPFTDFIYTDDDYGKALEIFSTLSFYTSVCETVSEDHRVLVFDVLNKTFEYSLRTAIGTFKSLHKKGLHKCYQALEDYRRNFYTADSVKVSRSDVADLLSSHISILSSNPISCGDASSIHDHTSSE
jgi:hypothetical protein